MPHVVSVNVGPVREVPWGTLKRSGIDKRSVETPVRIGTLGLESDEIADLKHHGGPERAVYAYAAEDLHGWAAEMGRTPRAGEFGENLTTWGVDVQDARLGERWEVGTALLEVCDVRIPCSVFQGFVDQPRWVKRFTQRGVPGAYLRVLREGVVQVGDEVRVVERRDHGLTVGHTFRALTTERHLLPSLADEPRASSHIRAKLDEGRNDSAN